MSTKAKVNRKTNGVTEDLASITGKLNKSNVDVSFCPGDTVEVYVRVKEGEKERVQVFKGLILKIQGSGCGRSFTVRKISYGVGVEKTFPFTSPFIQKVKLISRGEVRRAKLYYIRNLKGKAARIKSELAR